MLVTVIEIQVVRDVDLIRPVNVLPSSPRHGIAGALLEQLRRANTRRMLVGTWADADWAIRFLYLRHGFELVAPERKTALLKTYWIIRDRVRPRDFAQGGGARLSARGVCSMQSWEV